MSLRGSVISAIQFGNNLFVTIDCAFFKCTRCWTSFERVTGYLQAFSPCTTTYLPRCDASFANILHLLQPILFFSFSFADGLSSVGRRVGSRLARHRSGACRRRSCLWSDGMLSLLSVYMSTMWHSLRETQYCAVLCYVTVVVSLCIWQGFVSLVLQIAVRGRVSSEEGSLGIFQVSAVLCCRPASNLGKLCYASFSSLHRAGAHSWLPIPQPQPDPCRSRCLPP